MAAQSHLWAIGFDDMERARQVRDEIVRLAWQEHYLILEDVAVLVRDNDGSFSLNREAFPAVANVLGCSAVGLLVGLMFAAPLIGATIGTLLGTAGTATAAAVGIGDDFVRDVEGLMKPGTSALFVLDDAGDMDVILHAIRGLGGKVLRTNVDLERARLIQSTLAAARDETPAPAVAPPE